MNAFHLFPLVLVFLDPVGCQQDQITNTNLDIVFLLDQERTNLSLTGYVVDTTCSFWTTDPEGCKRLRDLYQDYSNYKGAYSGVEEWLWSFFDKQDAKETQFAVIFSCNKQSGGIMRYLNEVNSKEKILSLLEDGKNGIKYGCKKSLAWMMQLANKAVFTQGHRTDATPIVIVVSDCVQEEDSLSRISEIANEFNYFFHTLKGQAYFVCFADFIPLRHEARFRETFKMQIEMFRNVAIEILRTNNQTRQSMIYLDWDKNDVGQRLDQLLPKRSGFKDVNCSQTWNCSVCGGNGTCFQRCEWITLRNAAGFGASCTKMAPLNQSCTCPSSTPQPKHSTILPIVLSICCLLFVVFLGFVVALCYVRARNDRKKRAKNKALANKAPGKKVEIGVNLSTAKSTESVVGEGSKVKSVSMVKHGSVTNSLDKMGSVNKSSNVNSIVKSKASKSVTGKNNKSIGKSKKSIVSKSQVSKIKKPVAN